MPSALAAWSVTAAGIVWPIGPGVAVAFLACGAVGLLAARSPAAACCGPGRRVIGVAVVGAGFGFAVGLRSDAVRDHPVAHRFGSTSWVTVTPGRARAR